MNATPQALGGLAPWFGSKRILAKRIVAELGPHKVYWEIFAGSMAVLLAKPPCRMEVVNDLHGDLINLARCVRSPTLGPALYRRLRRVLAATAEFDAAVATLAGGTAPAGDDLDPDRAFAYFIASWQGMNGIAGTAKQTRNAATRYSSTGGANGTRWAAAVRSIPTWRRRLEQVQVLRGDGLALAARIEDRAGTVIYADPPYLAKGAKYFHDFAAEDHRALAAVLGRFRATRVVVSYYDHPDLPALYPGWRVVPLTVNKAMLHPGRRDEGGGTAAPEVLLCNLPAIATSTPGPVPAGLLDLEP